MANRSIRLVVLSPQGPDLKRLSFPERSVVMIRYSTHPDAPHLVVELEGTISGATVKKELRTLPDDLASMPDQFVMLALYPDAGLVEAEALRPLFYLVAQVFEADPHLCVFVDGGHSPHPGLRSFINQIGLDGQVAFVRTKADAEKRIASLPHTRG